MGLFSLIFTLGVNKKPLEQGLQSAKSHVSSFATVVRGHMASALSIGVIADWIHQVTEAVGRWKDLSEQTGVGTEEIQRADYALKQSGLAFEDLTTALNHLAQARRDAVEGNEELRATFARYGLSIQQLNDPQRTNYDLLKSISEVLSKTNLSGREQVEVMDLLGARAGKLANVLGELAKQKPPVIVSSDDIERIDKATKSLEKIKDAAIAIGAKLFGSRLQSLGSAGEAYLKGEYGKAATQFLNATSPVPFVRNVINETEDQKAKVAKNDQELIDFMNGVVGFFTGPRQEGLFQVDKQKKDNKEATKPKEARTPSDSLIAVGNFLGSDSNRSVMREVHEVKKSLQKIEQHTKRVADGAVVIRK